MDIAKKDFTVSLVKIINYLETDEKRDYESIDGISNDHIYLDIVKARDYMLENIDHEPDFSNEYLSHRLVLESSVGVFIASLATGTVISRVHCDDDPENYKYNEKFDLNEWRYFHKKGIPPQLDI